jgi:hemin uptake protein HemP
MGRVHPFSHFGVDKGAGLLIMIINISQEGADLKDDQPNSGPPPQGGRSRKQVNSKDLFPPGETEVWILHGEENYRLQITKSGKLILTK